VPQRSLCLEPALRTRLEGLASAGYPEETCGLLLGRCTENRVNVFELVAARNLNRERAQDRYELDPQAFLAADRQAREHGWEVVGVWHTHPDHPARPSATDRAAAWEGWSYVILSVDPNGVVDLRSWRLHAGDFIEEPAR
jgi:proteasome lid subunit RPN8/RPN11